MGNARVCGEVVAESGWLRRVALCAVSLMVACFRVMERHVSVDYSGSDSSGVEAHLHVAIATSLSIDWINVDWSAGVVGLQECVCTIQFVSMDFADTPV